MKNFQRYFIIFLAVLLALIVSASTFYANRWANYKLSYQGMVAEQIKPLELRIKVLEDVQTNTAPKTRP